MLEAILDGTLAQKVCAGSPDLIEYFEDTRLDRCVNASTGPRPRVSEWLTRLQTPYCPALYMRVFVDQEGRSPTPAQLRSVIEHLHMYISGNNDHADTCASIDNQGSELSTPEDIRQ